MDKKFKKGDTVCVYCRYRQTREIHETIVTVSGRKYITTEYDPHNKFDVDSLCSEHGGYGLFKGTKEECEKYIAKMEKASQMRRRICSYFDMPQDDFDLIEQVYNMIFPEKESLA